MATNFRYLVHQPQTSAQDYPTNPSSETRFHLEVHYCRVLQLTRPESDPIPADFSTTEYLVAADRLLSPELGEIILCQIFTCYGVSSSFLDLAVPEVLAFARNVAADERNAGRTILPLAVGLFEESAYSDQEELDRALSESMAQNNATTPATRASVEALERVRYQALSGVELEELCAICLDEFSVQREKGFRRMPCLHLFHEGCITRWLRTSHSCPLCRYALPRRSSDQV